MCAMLITAFSTLIATDDASPTLASRERVVEEFHEPSYFPSLNNCPVAVMPSGDDAENCTVVFSLNGLFVSTS